MELERGTGVRIEGGAGEGKRIELQPGEKESGDGGSKELERGAEVGWSWSEMAWYISV